MRNPWICSGSDRFRSSFNRSLYILKINELKEPCIIRESPDLVALMLGQEIHFVDQAKDTSVLGIGPNGIQTGLIVVKITAPVPTLDIKHVNKHLDVFEYAVLLGGKVVLHKRFLTTAIPQIQHEIPEKFDVGMLHIDYRSFRSAYNYHRIHNITHWWHRDVAYRVQYNC